MDKYKAFLEGKQGEDKLLQDLLNQVCENKIDEAKGTAARIMAVRDIKWELLKLDKNGH
jgi:hypothetical protein